MFFVKKVENKKTLGEILKKIDQLLGGTTTPLLSAECQHEILQGLILTLSRD